jgi:hypothetical protein
MLCRSGSGALAWWQIRNTPLANTSAGEQLHEVYRRFRLSALIHEREIAYVFSLLRDAGIEAVLVKGWAIARRYPDPALRPYGDIDICVAPDQIEEAQHALRCLENLEGHCVDLHAGFSRIGQGEAANGKNVGADLRVRPRFAQLQKRAHTQVRPYDSREWDEVFARSSVVECGGQPVRIPCDEDHLRLLSMHLLRSGAWRPAWLCDIALLLEQVSSFKFQVPGSLPRDLKLETRNLKPAFDWAICLGRNQVHINWVRTTMALAHELLGANENDVQGPTSNVQSPELPRWLGPAVLKQWGRSRVLRGSSPTVREGFGPLKGAGALPDGRATAPASGHWTDLYRRWDNPIRATAAVGGEFNNWPRLPYRLAESLMRLPELGKRRRTEVGRQRSEVGKQRSEVGGQKAEGRRQKAERGTQRAEGERQRAEGRSQRTGQPAF